MLCSDFWYVMLCYVFWLGLVGLFVLFDELMNSAVFVSFLKFLLNEFIRLFEMF